MNKAITSALRIPNTIINDVVMTDHLDMGSPVIKITQRGQAYSDYTTVAELRRFGKPDYVGEGKTYKNIYFCDATVPAEVQEILK